MGATNKGFKTCSALPHRRKLIQHDPLVKIGGYWVVNFRCCLTQ